MYRKQSAVTPLVFLSLRSPLRAISATHTYDGKQQHDVDVVSNGVYLSSLGCYLTLDLRSSLSRSLSCVSFGKTRLRIQLLLRRCSKI